MLENNEKKSNNQIKQTNVGWQPRSAFFKGILHAWAKSALSVMGGGGAPLPSLSP